MNTRVYIIVDRRLSKSQRIPQAAHAMAEFMHEHGQRADVTQWVEDDRTLVCLQADESEIEQILRDARFNGIPTAEFRDDDLHSMRTAIAVGPLTRKQGEGFFGHLRLA